MRAIGEAAARKSGNEPLFPALAYTSHRENHAERSLHLPWAAKSFAQERAISIIAGLGLAAAGTKPRPNPILNVTALIGGAYLAIRGATGRCPIKQALQSMPMTRVAAEAKVPAKRSRVAGR